MSRSLHFAIGLIKIVIVNHSLKYAVNLFTGSMLDLVSVICAARSLVLQGIAVALVRPDPDI